MTTDPRVGTVLAGCRIESEIGRGGMGVVYLAEHLHLGRKVALKLITPELASDDRFRQRFIRESRVAATIDHGNVLPVYDAGEADGLLYIAMRFVDGDDLKAVIAREAPLEPARAVEIVRLIAAGLDAAHAEGLVHRDVKPANVLIGRDGHVFLTDFGLTKQSDSTSLTGTGLAVGTIAYMAPEQFQSGEVDARSDVYSLGCVLFECLTGGVPFDRPAQAAVMYAHLHDPPPRPTDLRPEIPAGLDAVVARAMAKRKQERYPTCGELADDALHAIDPSAVTRPSVSRPERRRVGGLRLVAVAAALGVVAVLLFRSLLGGDGATFVTYQLEDDTILRVAAVAGAKPVRVSTLLDELSPRAPDEWMNTSANGAWLLVSTERFNCPDYACLVVVDGAFERAEVVKVRGEAVHAPFGDISSDGNLVVYSEQGTHDRDLWAIRREKNRWSEPVELTKRSVHENNEHPSVSPDSARIAFECGPQPYGLKGTAICEVRSDGSGFRVAVEPDSDEVAPSSKENALTHPSYAEDGSLLFDADWEPSGIWRLRRDSPLPERLDVEGEAFDAPCGVSAGRVIAVLEGRPDGGSDPEIVLLDPPSTEVVTIAPAPRIYGPTLNCSG